MLVNYRLMGLVISCLRVTDAVVLPSRSLEFKGLSGTASVVGRCVSYHQVHDLYVPLLDFINKITCLFFKYKLDARLSLISLDVKR